MHSARSRRVGSARQPLRRVPHEETLAAVAAELSSVVDITELMRRIARRVGLALSADMVGAFLADADRAVLRPIAGWHVPKHFVEGFVKYAIPLRGHRILEEAWRRQAPVWLEDVGADPRVDREAFARFPHRSSLFCPIVVRDAPAGGLFVTWWDAARRFAPDELQMVDAISRQAGAALATTRVAEHLRAHQARLEGLLGASRALLDAERRAAPVNHYGTLTPRERTVLHLAAEGCTTAAIGALLSISARTAEVHRANLMRKLGLRGQTELVRYAMSRGLLSSGEPPDGPQAGPARPPAT